MTQLRPTPELAKGRLDPLTGMLFACGRGLGGVGTLPRAEERAVRLDSVFYRLAYRAGKPAWDSDEPHPELNQIIAGRQPGRALDLGCGTGADAVFLAHHGWEVVGVDFVPAAINRARSTASSARFILGDVTQLREAGVGGPFDLIIDIGCYHAIPSDLRDAYVAEVAAVARPGADLYLVAISKPPASWRLLRAEGVSTDELRRRFDGAFELADQHSATAIGRASNFVLYHLVRTQEVAGSSPASSIGRSSRLTWVDVHVCAGRQRGLGCVG